jgi:hypothetical protein
MKKGPLKTNFAKIWIDDHGICHNEYIPETTLSLEESKNELKVISEIADGNPIPILVYLINVKSIPRECRELYASEGTAKIISGAALLIGSPVSRVIGSFFLGLNKPRVPVKLFTSKSDAIKWLLKFI